MFGLRRAFRLQLILHTPHRDHEIAAITGPPRRVNPRRSAQRLDLQTGIVGKRGLAGRERADDRLQPRIVVERFPGLLRFGDAEFTCALRRDAKRLKQLLNFPQLAFVMGRNHKRIAALQADTGVLIFAHSAARGQRTVSF